MKPNMKLGHDISESKSRWPEITDDLLEELESWGIERSLGKIPAEQLAIFAHSCYYDKIAILKCMDIYYRMRRDVTDFFTRRDALLEHHRQNLKVV